MKSLHDILKMRDYLVTTYYLHYKKKFEMTKTIYNLYLYYKSEKFNIINFIYWLKVYLNHFCTSHIVKFLSDNNILLNKQL